jgi:hypothetical protein
MYRWLSEKEEPELQVISQNPRVISRLNPSNSYVGELNPCVLNYSGWGFCYYQLNAILTLLALVLHCAYQIVGNLIKMQ